MNEIIKQALEKQKKLEKEKELKKQNLFKNYEDYEQIEYLSLENDKQKAFRIVGKPFIIRDNPFDIKMVMQSQILVDEGNFYLKVNWPYVEKFGDFIPDPNWILTKLYNKVNEGNWEGFTEDDIDGIEIFKDELGKIVNRKGNNAKFVKKHKKTEVFNRVERNQKKGDLYPKFFYPSSNYVMNVIDRHDNWCKINKHTKVLTRKVTISEKQNDQGETIKQVWAETGISKNLYTLIWNYVVRHTNSFDMDLIIDQYVTDKKPNYIIHDATDISKLNEEIKSIVSSDPMTEEEKNYKCYDLDKLYSPTKYFVLKKYLGGLFKSCDLNLNTNFCSELDYLVEKETEEWKKQNEQKEKYSGIIKEEIKREKKEDKNQGELFKEEKKEELTINDQCKKYFPKWDILNVFEKSIITGSIISFKDGIPEWEAKSNPLVCAESDCKFINSTITTSFPEDVHTCPVCGCFCK